jgi:predicted nucleic acid-binding protein
MHNTIISDTSCLILRDKINERDILKRLYGEVIITSFIAQEYGKSLPTWIKIIDPKNNEFQNELLKSLDRGEASAITLAIELEDCTLILDEEPARKKAIELGLTFTGTVGVLAKAKREGFIPLLKPYFDKIELTDFHTTPELLRMILKSVGE